MDLVSINSGSSPSYVFRRQLHLKDRLPLHQEERYLLRERKRNFSAAYWSSRILNRWIVRPDVKLETSFSTSLSRLTWVALASLCIPMRSPYSTPHISFTDFVMAARSWLVRNHRSTASSLRLIAIVPPFNFETGLNIVLRPWLLGLEQTVAANDLHYGFRQ